MLWFPNNALGWKTPRGLITRGRCAKTSNSREQYRMYSCISHIFCTNFQINIMYGNNNIPSYHAAPIPQSTLIMAVIRLINKMLGLWSHYTMNKYCLSSSTCHVVTTLTLQVKIGACLASSWQSGYNVPSQSIGQIFGWKLKKDLTVIDLACGGILWQSIC